MPMSFSLSYLGISPLNHSFCTLIVAIALSDSLIMIKF